MENNQMMPDLHKSMLQSSQKVHLINKKVQ